MKISLIEELSGIGLVAMIGEKTLEAVHFLLMKTVGQSGFVDEPTDDSSEEQPISATGDGSSTATE